MSLNKLAVLSALAVAGVVVPAPAAHAVTVTACVVYEVDAEEPTHCETGPMCASREGRSPNSLLVEQITGTDLYDHIDHSTSVCVTP